MCATPYKSRGARFIPPDFITGNRDALRPSFSSKMKTVCWNLKRRIAKNRLTRTVLPVKFEKFWIRCSEFRTVDASIASFLHPRHGFLRRSVVGFVVHRCSLWRSGAATVIHSVGYSPTASALHHRRLAC